MENNLQEPFKTAFNSGDSIDYKTNGHVSDHNYVKKLGYQPEMHSDCSYSAKGLQGISLSSYGNWGTVYPRWMDDTSKRIFLDMYNKGLISLWRITRYNNGHYTYEEGAGWVFYSKEECTWKTCNSPYKTI